MHEKWGDLLWHSGQPRPSARCKPRPSARCKPKRPGTSKALVQSKLHFTSCYIYDQTYTCAQKQLALHVTRIHIRGQNVVVEILTNIPTTRSYVISLITKRLLWRVLEWYKKWYKNDGVLHQNMRPNITGKWFRLEGHNYGDVSHSTLVFDTV